MSEPRIRSISFTSDMLKLVNEGKKTATRRVMLTQPVFVKSVEQSPDGNFFRFACENKLGQWEYQVAPRYRRGDILYAPEPWRCVSRTGELGYEVEFKDGQRVAFEFKDPERAKTWAKYADKPKDAWQSPYFMPREAARTWLCVTDVGADRLTNMSFQDLLQEGFVSGPVCDHKKEIAVLEFSDTWDRMISSGNRDRYGWAADPWVWIYHFERCEKPTAAA